MMQLGSAAAVLVTQFARGEENGQFALGFLGVVEIGRVERARRADFRSTSNLMRSIFGKRFVIRAAAGTGQQFGDAAGVDFGVLAQVDRCQMEAENLYGAQQAAQAATGQVGAAVQLERIVEYLEIVAQSFRRFVWLCVADFMAERLELVEATRAVAARRA
jgi:hypothetical protein